MGPSRFDDLYTHGPLKLAGVDVLPSAAAELARRLYHAGEHALSDYIGGSVDALRLDVPLTPADYPVILSVLPEHGVSPDLARLREALQPKAG
jgi:hypothetical protein